MTFGVVALLHEPGAKFDTTLTIAVSGTLL